MNRFSFLIALAILCMSPALAGQNDSVNDLLVKNLPWRCIGPAVMGGRVDDFAVVESNPSTFYVATAAGGVFKTTNHGTTFESVFDAQACLSIGDVTVAPSNPSIVWVGTGEANNRQSASWGSGVYKSSDAGKTWSFMGLPNTRTIGRIVIDPKNPDVVYVAAGGDLWAPNPERGVYKTADGGKTWTQSLAVNSDTGCTDLAIDAQSPETVYAAMYQRRRTPSGFNGGGPGSGIYKTSDAGAHWQQLTQGLPAGDKGRIGLDIYRKNSSIVYASVESEAPAPTSTAGPGPGGGQARAATGSTLGIFRSQDKGETWTKMGTVSAGLNAFRPMYFSQIRIDPNNDQNIMLSGVTMGWSGDGGKTFETNIAGVSPQIHPDIHAIWIDPANSRHILVGCDGGIQWTFDQGATWDHNNTLPIAQFYEVAYDMRKPYWVYGGLQDNGSWGAPSTSLGGRGVTNADWINVGGGDGFYCQADPTDANTVYSESQQGAVARLNVGTGERKSIRPTPAPGEAAYRFDWNTPILISHHNHNRIYLGGNKLFISDDRGDSWRSTPDLSTSPDRTKIPIMGVLPSSKILSLNDGQDSFGEIVTVSESPAQMGVIWAGTDDGNVQVSRDDGKTWKNVADRLPGVPRGTYVTRVLASYFAPGRAYVALDGHRTGDLMPHLLVTEDFGETWQPITTGIQEHDTLKAICEHPRNPALLFAGTERGAFVSFNRGGAWMKLGGKLPAVPVNDIKVHPRENDLILATHGRGMWILDDISPMEQLADRSSSGSFYLCEPRPAVEYRSSFGQSWGGNRVFYGDNAPAGASIPYFIRATLPATTPAKIVILDRSGKQVVAEFKNLALDAGVHRFRWDMRYSGPATADAQAMEADLAGAARSSAVQDEEERDAQEKDAGAGQRESKQLDADDQGSDRGSTMMLGRRLFAACVTVIAQNPQIPDPAPGAGVRRGRRGAGGQGGAGQPGGAGQGRQGRAGGAGGGQGAGGGGQGRFGGRGGQPRVLPGVYLVRMTVGTEEQTREIKVEDDPRVHIADRDRKALFDQQLRVMKLSQSYTEARRALTTLRTDVTKLQESAEVTKSPESVKQSLTALATDIKNAQPIVADGRKAAPKTSDKPAETPAGATESGQPAAPTPGPGQAQAGIIQLRLARLSQSLNGITEPVSKYQKQETDALTELVRQAVDVVNSLTTSDAARANKALTENKIKALTVPAPIPRPR